MVKSKAIEHAIAIAAINAIFSIENPASIKKPNKIDYLFSLTEAYLNADKFKKSIKVLQKIENDLGVSEDLSLQKHQIFAFLKKKKKAIRELENYIEKDPKNLRVIGILAEYYDSYGKGGETEILNFVLF